MGELSKESLVLFKQAILSYTHPNFFFFILS